ncbi:MAG: hypothetical protein WDN06_02265 [Asticcacaulis sp.]
MSLTATAYAPPTPEILRGRLTSAAMVGTQLLGAIIGGLIILRGGRRLSVLLIGAAIACNSLSGSAPPIWLSHPAIVALAAGMLTIVFNASAMLFFAFARRFRFETTGKDGPVLRWIWRGLAILLMTNAVVNVWTDASNIPYPLIGSSYVPTAALIWSGFALTFLTLVMGWRDSQGEMRSRYAILLAAISFTHDASGLRSDPQHDQ